MSKKPRIGLVLAGGGAKGAYQVGVWKAICEYKLDKKVCAIAANSIGSLNTLMFLQYTPDECRDIWLDIDNATVMSKQSIVTKIRTKSLFARTGVRKLLEEKIDTSIYDNLDIPVYITTADVESGDAKYWLLNGRSKDEIFDIVLASSAIPGVFGSVEIEGRKYEDGMHKYNVPTLPVLEHGCDILFVVPLNGKYEPTEQELSFGIPIVSFDSTYTAFGYKGGTLIFNEEFSRLRMEHGYNVGIQLIKKIRKMSLIKPKFIDKLRGIFVHHRKKPYYNIPKEEMKDKIEVEKGGNFFWLLFKRHGKKSSKQNSTKTTSSN